ncbi:MAG: phosphorylase, partial [Firmicutes bacterium]|nr:phosphorylase [Bacillota bacterium]
EYHGQLISFIRCGIGAPMTGDVILSLACTPCQRVIFTGSVGGLDASMKIGDVLIPKKSLSGDGFSRYLGPDVETEDCFLQPAEPDSELQMTVMKHASKICKRESVALHSGTVFSTDSVIAQFFRLEQVVKNLGCIGIEMETSSVFKAAKLVDIRASALLQVSDVIPLNKSLFSGRSKREMERRQLVKRTVLAKAVLDSVIDDIT